MLVATFDPHAVLFLAVIHDQARFGAIDDETNPPLVSIGSEEGELVLARVARGARTERDSFDAVFVDDFERLRGHEWRGVAREFTGDGSGSTLPLEWTGAPADTIEPYCTCFVDQFKGLSAPERVKLARANREIM